MRLIDADKLPYVEDETYFQEFDYCYRYAIDAEPTVQAVPEKALRKAAKKLAYIHQRIDLYGDRDDLHDEDYWYEYLLDEEWEDPDIA